MQPERGQRYWRLLANRVAVGHVVRLREANHVEEHIVPALQELLGTFASLPTLGLVVQETEHPIAAFLDLTAQVVGRAPGLIEDGQCPVPLFFGGGQFPDIFGFLTAALEFVNLLTPLLALLQGGLFLALVQPVEQGSGHAAQHRHS